MVHEYYSALKDFNKANSINPNIAVFYEERGLTKIIINHLNGASRDLAIALKINPDSKRAKERLDKIKSTMAN